MAGFLWLLIPNMPQRSELTGFLPGRGFEPPSDRRVPRRIEPRNPRIKATRERPPLKFSFKESGRETFNIENLTVAIEYEMPNANNLSPEAYANFSERGKMEKYRVLKKIDINNGEETLELAALLPEGTAVVFSANSRAPITSGAGDYEKKVIFISSNLSEAETIFMLLHEIGHAIRYNKVVNFEPTGKTAEDQAKAEEKKQLLQAHVYLNFFRSKEYYGHIPDEALSEIARDEGTAWSFAFKTMDKFLNSKPGSMFNRRAVVKHIEYRLRQYLKEIGKHYMALMAREEKGQLPGTIH